MKVIDRQVTYARTTTTYILETEEEKNTPNEVWEKKLTGFFGGYVQRFGDRLIVANYDD